MFTTVPALILCKISGDIPTFSGFAPANTPNLCEECGVTPYFWWLRSSAIKKEDDISSDWTSLFSTLTLYERFLG